MGVLGETHFTVASLVGVVQAAVGLAVAFGAGLSTAEQDAIVAVVTALAAALPIGGAVLSHATITTTPQAVAPAVPPPPAAAP